MPTKYIENIYKYAQKDQQQKMWSKIETTEKKNFCQEKSKRSTQPNF